MFISGKGLAAVSAKDHGGRELRESCCGQGERIAGENKSVEEAKSRRRMILWMLMVWLGADWQAWSWLSLDVSVDGCGWMRWMVRNSRDMAYPCTDASA